VEDDQFAGLGHGEGAEQNLVEERKHGSCRRYTEGQGADGHHEEARLAEQRASREADVAPDTL
jgi:hypothetical protein